MEFTLLINDKHEKRRLLEAVDLVLFKAKLISKLSYETLNYKEFPQDISHVANYPLIFTDTKEFVEYMQDNQRTERTVLLEYEHSRFDYRIKTFKNGLKGLRDFLTSNYGVKVTKLIDFDSAFVEMDDVVPYEVESQLVKQIKSGVTLTEDSFSYCFLHGRVLLNTEATTQIG